MILSSQTPGPLSLATAEPWKPSVFRPPPRFVKSLAPKYPLAANAQPWYPNGNGPAMTLREPRLVPPPALGQSPPGSPEPSAQPPLIDSLCLLSANSSRMFSPLTTPVRTRSHCFTDEATEACVYPQEMFMSVRRDAAHTPHGVLVWAVRKYIEIPSLKVPPHLQLSMHESALSDDGVTRGAFGSGLKAKMRAKPVRMTHHKVMSILSRITPQKYDVLHKELMMLPLRQADDEELKEICKVVFEKAVQEPDYSGLYARLARDIGAIDSDQPMTERSLSRRFRFQLIASCEEQFQRPLQLSADDMVDRTTGELLCVREAEMKRDRLKNRLVGNIRFVAELFKMGVLAERVIKDIVHVLVGNYDPANPLSKEEYVFEVFATLVRHTGAILCNALPLLLARALGVAKTIELSHPKPRVRFLMMDLHDLNRKKEWVSEDTVQKYVQAVPEAPLPQQTRKEVEQYALPKASQEKSEGTQQKQQQQQRQQKANQEPERGKPLGNKGRMELREIQKCDVQSNVSSLSNAMNSSISTTTTTTTTPSSNHNNNHNNSRAANRSISISSTTNTTNTNTTNNVIVNANNTDRNNNNNNNLSTSTTTVRHRSQHEPYSSLVLTCVTDLSMSTCSNPHQMNSPPTSERAFSDCAGLLSPRPQRSSEFGGNSCQTSDGLPSPWAAGRSRATPLTETVNMKDVTRQLMAMFRSGGGEEDAVALRLRDMGLQNAIVCLTWWLRLAATHTSLFEDRSRIAALFSALMRTGACDASSLYSTVLEWLRFDLEKGEYDNCPRMFDNVAQMILQCHQKCNDALPHIGVVRGMWHCGLMNVVLRDLSTSGGTEKMVTAVKSFHPVCAQVLQCLREPEDERLILRIAAQNRFRLLPYLMSVSADGASAQDSPHSSMRTRRVSLLLSPSRSNPSGDTLTSTVHYDPLAQCLCFPRVSEDAEFALFRRARDSGHSSASSASSCSGNVSGNGTASLRDEALCAALVPAGGGSTASQLVAVMRVVGALLAGGCVAQDAVDEVVAGVVAERPGVLFQAAAVVELIMFHTQSFRGSTEEAPARRMERARQTFGHWQAAGIIDGGAVLRLLETRNEPNDENCVYTIFHDHITDVPWGDVLHELRRVF